MRQRRSVVGRARTRVNLIEAAERLFGAYGMNGVSLRRISIEAGSANHDAITYHFKTRIGLVQAIFEHRLPAAEERRSAMFAAIEQSGREPTTRELIAIIYTPFLEEVDHCGKRTFAAFVGAYYRSRRTIEECDLSTMTPVTAHLAALLAERMPHLSRVQISRRFSLVNHMMLNGIYGADEHEAQAGFDELLDMAVAAVRACGDGGRGVRPEQSPSTCFTSDSDL
jgi:AcrR family transcriptional regulator